MHQTSKKLLNNFLIGVFAIIPIAEDSSIKNESGEPQFPRLQSIVLNLLKSPKGIRLIAETEQAESSGDR